MKTATTPQAQAMTHGGDSGSELGAVSELGSDDYSASALGSASTLGSGSDSAVGRLAPRRTIAPPQLQAALQYIRAVHELLDWAPAELAAAGRPISLLASSASPSWRLNVKSALPADWRRMRG